MKRAVLIVGCVAMLAVIVAFGLAWFLVEGMQKSINGLKMSPAIANRWPKKSENGKAEHAEEEVKPQPTTT